MGLTLTQLQARVREVSDRANDPHLSDTICTNLINDAYERLHNLIVSANDRFFIKDHTPFVTASGTANYDLPTDFYKLISVNVSDDSGTSYKNVDKYVHSQRNHPSMPMKYRLSGSKLRLVPTPTSARYIKIEYVPTITKLSSGSDQLELTVFDSYVIYKAAILALQVEESDATHLERELAKIESEILAYVASDDAEPDGVSDFYDNDSD